MAAYAARRLVQLLPVLLGISLVSFGLMHLSPGDPAALTLGARGVAPTEELLAATRHDMGLDRPLVEQYFSWLGGVVSGDLGWSHRYGVPVSQIIGQRLPVTIALSAASLVLVVCVAVPLGIAAALSTRPVVRAISRVVSFVSLSMPTFWFGLLLIYLFAAELGWFPAVSSASDPRGYVLPAVALAFSFLGRLVEQVRTSVLDELGRPYVEGLLSRGVPLRRVVWRHVMRNALCPSVTVVALAFAAMLSGAVATETVFSLQGLGVMSVEAVAFRDYPLVQGYVLVTAALYVLVNLVVDLVYVAANPRVRLGGGAL